jgi:hypothetical protein
MRGTTVVRLVVYGFVLLIALLVWQVRTHPRPQSSAAANAATLGTPLLGRTMAAGGSPITAYVRDGRMHSVAVTVRFPCADIWWDTPIPLVLENEVDDAKHAFAATRKAQYRVDLNGWQAVLTLQMDGRLTRDEKRASGTATTWITWLRNGVAAQTCEARTERWQAVRP